MQACKLTLTTNTNISTKDRELTKIVKNMAISREQPLLLLIVSLFLLPAALGATKFQTCNTGHRYPVDVKTVKISPEHVKPSTNANVTITGSTSIDIPDGATVKLRLTLGMYPVSTKSYSLCDITACPVAAGPIVLNFSNVFTKKELSAYAYYIVIDISADPERESMMCVWFACGISHRSLHSQATN
ncbi:unnamed protein product [Brassica rapa subsp. trilocularis]